MPSAISWTDETWNPVVGCTKVSAGCDNCYASTLHNKRYKANVKVALDLSGIDNAAAALADVRHAEAGCDDGKLLPFPAQYDVPFRQVQLKPERLALPLRWRRPRRVFVNSVSDLFHEEVPDAFIDSVFAVMALSPAHVFQVLTKRPERMREYLTNHEMPLRVWEAADRLACSLNFKGGDPFLSNGAAAAMQAIPLPNLWLGTSCEDQERADKRVPELLATPAARRFLSCEPLLGPIDLERWLEEDGYESNGPAGWITTGPRFDWVIVGGESGLKHRLMDLEWVRSIREQCRAAGVAYFGKQDHGSRPEKPLPGELGDREWPA